jgi:hypothetical protein
MDRHRLVGVLAALVWTMSCVAILDVDADDYQDLDQTICGCADPPETCEGVIQKRLSDAPELAEVAFGCLAESDGCCPLETCLAADVCIEAGKNCSNAPGACESQGSLKFQCCEGTACAPNPANPGGPPTCQVPCPDPKLGEACTGTCCNGLECGPQSTCCISPGETCERNDDCCRSLDAPAICNAGTCSQCSLTRIGCNQDFPCCDGGPCDTCVVTP